LFDLWDADSWGCRARLEYPLPMVIEEKPMVIEEEKGGEE
jgi:hypothetical protein